MYGPGWAILLMYGSWLDLTSSCRPSGPGMIKLGGPCGARP